MPYAADIDTVKTNANKGSHFGESQECVAAVKHFAKAPQTGQWKKGALVKGNTTLKSGTAIATFRDNGTYHGHAAIYIKQDAGKRYVYDQWKGQPL